MKLTRCFRVLPAVAFALILSAVTATVALATDSVIHLTAGTGADIQQALDRLPAKGEVTLGEGTFLVSTPIFLRKSGQTLRGSGTNTLLFLADNANCPVIILGSPLDPAGPTTKDIQVLNLTINGNRRQQQSELWQHAVDGCQLNNNGINIWNTTDVKVSKVVAAHCRSGGLVTAAGVRRLTVEHYESYDNEFDGLACYQTEESRFTDMYLHSNPAAGISLDLAFNGNVIERVVLERNDLGIFMRESNKNSFRDITIRDSRNHGVFIAQRAELTPGGWTFFKGTECLDNVFEGLATVNCGGKPYLVNDATCTGNRFTEITLPVLADKTATSAVAVQETASR